jgi:hypothetical protein
LVPMCCLIFNTILSYFSSIRFPGYHPPTNLWILILKLMGFPYHPTGWGSLKAIKNFGPKHLTVATLKAMGFQSFTNDFIYNAVCYYIEFPAVTDISKGLLTCIQDCNMSGECNTPLMSLWLTGQRAAGVRWCSLKILNVDIEQMPQEFIKKNENCEC